ncbi:NADPH-dependent FMN reductase [Agrococcus beijingensis]|uniref:NADPH-dependent FMN reductase n=1 Tax=Agrococcus beijingensis TaxID=3068634 RepID=UPI0027416767|nr:NADPH-dependent FMN reductase [Agrococcus sp. REN33]
MTKIAIIAGSTRPNRIGLGVAQWVTETANQRGDAEYELVDVADFNLPLLDEPMPGAQTQEHTQAWAAKIAEFDGFVFVAGEYNHSVQPALANALSYLNAEFNNKAAGIVGYGSAYGVRAIEHLRAILTELQVAHVQKTGMFSLFTDFENFSTFKPTEMQAASVTPMLDQLIVWTKALEGVRTGELVNA